MHYYLKKEWKLNMLAGFFLTAVSVCEVLTSLAMMQVFEHIIRFDLAGFLRWVAIDGSLFVLLLLFDQIGTVFKARAIRRMNNRVRMDVAASLARSDYQSFHAQDSGAYLSQLTNDIHQMEDMAWNTFFQCITTAAAVIASILALLTLHWMLAAVSVLSAAVMLNVPKLFGKKMEALGAVCEEKQAAGTGEMKDLLSGLDVLRSFGRTERFLTGMQEAGEQVEEPKYRLTWVKNLANNGIALVSLTVQMLINCLIGYFSIRGIILQGALMGGGNLCSGVTNGLANLARFRLAFAAAKPYFEKISFHAEDETEQDVQEWDSACNAIVMQDISFAYGEKTVLRKKSFQFDKGGKYALTGPSGCGKSTVLKLILGWLPEYQGSILFDGRNAREIPQEQRLSRMSYIGQDVFLFHTTIRDNITLGENFSEEALTRAVRESALYGDLAGMPLGLDTPVGENGSNLSGGQKQRVAIARALIHDRSILLVDEGTSALDQKNADIVEQSLLENPNLTLILVSHHLTPERKKQFTRVYELNAEKS